MGSRERLDVTILVQLTGVRPTIAVNFALSSNLHRSLTSSRHRCLRVRVTRDE